MPGPKFVEGVESKVEAEVGDEDFCLVVVGTGAGVESGTEVEVVKMEPIKVEVGTVVL